jgi:hypothetical protein
MFSRRHGFDQSSLLAGSEGRDRFPINASLENSVRPAAGFIANPASPGLTVRKPLPPHPGSGDVIIDKMECRPLTEHHALVAELVDALVSGTSGESRGGSSPLLGTKLLFAFV